MSQETLSDTLRPAPTPEQTEATLPAAGRSLRIERLRIEAFGQLSGTELSLAPGLNVLCGPNEAGKSTLLAFLRWMLFGFEKRAVGDRFAPHSGQALGGELLLSTASGPLWVRRQGRKRLDGELSVRTPRGEPVPASKLEDALGALSRELYFQVFAFGLDELATFDQLASQGAVSDALFAAGLQGAQRLPETRRLLKDASEGLYAPRAGTRPLNQLLGELESVQKELLALGDRPARYFQLRERQEALASEWRLVETARSSARSAADRWSRLCGAREELLRLAEVEAQLAALPSLEDFPEDGLARWEARADTERRALRELEAAQVELRGVEEALRQQGDAPALAALREEARTALEQYRGLTEVGRRVPEALRELETAESRTRSRVGALGLQGGAEALGSLDVSSAAAAQLLTVRDALAQAEPRLSERRAMAREAAAARDRRLEEQARLGEELKSLQGPALAALRPVQAALVQIAPLWAERRAGLDALADRQARREQVEAEVFPAPAAPFPVWLAALATLVLLLIPAAAFLLLGEPALPYGAGVFLGLAAVLWALQLRSAHGHREAVAQWQLRLGLRSRELERLEAELETLSVRQGGVEHALQDAWRRGGLEPGSSPAEAASRAQEVEELLRRAEARERAEASLRLLMVGLEEAQQQCAAAQESLAQAETGWVTLRDQLEAWLSVRGFPSGISAERAVELMHEAASLQETLSSLAQRRLQLEAQLAQWERAREQVLSVAERAALTARTAESAAQALEDGLEAERVRATTCKQLEVQRGGLTLKCQQRAAGWKDAKDAAVALLAAAGAADEESFRRLAESARRFREACAARTRLRTAVEARTALTVEAARAEVEGAGGWEPALAQLGLAEESLEAAEAQAKALSEERGAVGKELEGLEVDDQARRLRAQEESLRLQISALAERYATDRVALGLVETARRRYEEQHQPQLLRRASQVFATLTGGRYLQVKVPDGERGLVALSADGLEWSADRLSRGTREQLYLAFRIAAVEDLGESRARLPVIVDDVLVNFDAGRASAAADALADLSQRHQVLTFTCHPHMAELFVKHGGRVLELKTAGQQELLRLPA